MESPARIVVKPEDLERTITVWLKTMPRHLWAEYEKMLAIDPRRRRGEDRLDPRNVLAVYLAGKFAQAGWQASYGEPAPPRSPPAWGD